MAFETDWDDAFEALPTDENYGYEIDNYIRELKKSISQRMDVEHIWKIGATDGKHDPGKCSVFFYGTTAQIDALTGMSEGAIVFDITLGAIKIYTSSAWTILPFDWDNMFGAGDPVHTHTSDAEGGVLSSQLKFMTTPVNKVSWTAATDWTEVNISLNTGDDTAKAAYVALELTFQTGTHQTLASMTGLLRKKGSSETSVLPRIKGGSVYDQASSAGVVSYCRTACAVIVGCDTSEIFEVKLQTDSGSPTGIVFKVDLIGYFV